MSLNDPDGTTPVVFKTPCLGHAVRLGELYDQRSGLFLGVQLYPEENLEVVDTDVKHTDLNLTLSTTLEDKASLLDISAKLSLEVLSGLVSVSGSANYVKDTKSNTHEQAFALALKMRLQEKRILFAEDKLGRNVLTVASQDYIANKSATHFVSAIVYGGNLIVNLVARQSKLETNEKIEGQLQAKFDKLKGAISLEGEAKVGIQDEFKSMNDKFDLVIHGDVALDRVPVNPEDVLEIIPDGAKLIKDGGGVPIQVTLQPIPEALIIGSKVYEIDRAFVDEVLKIFSQLDDLHSRFSVLVDGTKIFEQYAPELARVARAAAAKYIDDHGALLYELRNFLDDYQHGKPLTERWEPDGDQHIPVLTDARDLYNRQIGLVGSGGKGEEDGDEDENKGEGEGGDDDDSLSDYYPSNLAGLEEELLKFQFFVSDVQESKDSVRDLVETAKKLVNLSSLDDFFRAMRLQNMIPLFIMSSFAPDRPKDEIDPLNRLTPDLAIIQFLAILRENGVYFNDSVNPARILYAETLVALDRRLPSLVTYLRQHDGVEKPALVIGEVGAGGDLLWSPPPPIVKFTSKIHHVSSGTRGVLSYPVASVDGKSVNGKESFTIQIRAKPLGSSTDSAFIVSLRTETDKKQFLAFQIQPLRARIWRNYEGSVPLDSPIDPQPSKPFVATFVQNLETLSWTFYLGNTQVAYADFTGPPELLTGSENVEVFYTDSVSQKWFNGEVTELRAFSYAFTTEQLEAELKKVAE